MAAPHVIACADRVPPELRYQAAVDLLRQARDLLSGADAAQERTRLALAAAGEAVSRAQRAQWGPGVGGRRP